MTITSRLSRALKLVKAFEVFHARATPQDDGFVIGYGHTASAREGAAVTRDEADELLIYDLGQIGKLLDGWVYAPMHDNQRQALIAFGFNVGAQNLQGSTALRRLNAGDYMGCAREIERWRMADLAGRGQVVDALVRRRAAEKALFLTPADGFLKTDSARLRPRFDGDPGPGPVAAPPVEVASAAMTAAQNVSARLRALLPDPEPEPEPELEPEPDPVEAQAVEPTTADVSDAPPAVAPKPVPDRDAAGDAILLDSIVLDPIRLEPAAPPTAEPAPATQAETASWPLDEMAPPPPPPFVPAARPRAPTLVSANDFGPDDFGGVPAPSPSPRPVVEPIRPTPERPAPAAQIDSPAATPLAQVLRERLAPVLVLIRQHGLLILGGVGGLLFVIAILSILTGKPSAANLAIGLVGVLCMTPLAYTLLGSRNPA